MLSKKISGKLKDPTTLIELTSKDHRRVLNKCIHVSGVLRVEETKKLTGTTLYDTVTYGCNLKTTRMKVDVGHNQ